MQKLFLFTRWGSYEIFDHWIKLSSALVPRINNDSYLESNSFDIFCLLLVKRDRIHTKSSNEMVGRAHRMQQS